MITVITTMITDRTASDNTAAQSPPTTVVQHHHRAHDEDRDLQPAQFPPRQG
jgi:hypothetical protein